MAIVSFLLLLLLIGVIDFARALNSYVVIINASREGARYASRFPHYKPGILRATKEETAGTSVALADEDIVISPEPDNDPDSSANAQAGEPITVTVSYDFPTILGDIVSAGSLTLRAQTVMVAFALDN
jgi:Flp pilus assembly protein TadG